MTPEQIEILQLQSNVKDLQTQLQKSYIRINELNKTISNFRDERSKILKVIRDNPNDQSLGEELRNMHTNESI
tara:strand:- start:260 stop:478 length:219 start_codon:yes stop_codon:yes gene_type:complete